MRDTEAELAGHRSGLAQEGKVPQGGINLGPSDMWFGCCYVSEPPIVTHPAISSILHVCFGDKRYNLQDFIPTLAGKVNVTQAKVGIKSCRLY